MIPLSGWYYLTWHPSFPREIIYTLLLRVQGPFWETTIQSCLSFSFKCKQKLPPRQSFLRGQGKFNVRFAVLCGGGPIILRRIFLSFFSSPVVPTRGWLQSKTCSGFGSMGTLLSFAEKGFQGALESILANYPPFFNYKGYINH